MSLAHVAMQIQLCRSAAQVSQGTTLAIHVTLVDRDRHRQLDQTQDAKVGDGDAVTVKFAAPGGAYRMRVQAPDLGCETEDYVYLLASQDRHMIETLSQGTVRARRPLYLFAGTLPPGDAYVHPAPVLFGSDVQCDEPAGSPIPTDWSIEYDRDAFYASLYEATPSAGNSQLTLALALDAPRGVEHFVYVPLPYPTSWTGWPVLFKLDVTQKMLDDLGPQPSGWLLCHKLSLSSAG